LGLKRLRAIIIIIIIIIIIRRRIIIIIIRPIERWNVERLPCHGIRGVCPL